MLEQRTRDIAKSVRCLVCQNQSINESNSPLAKELRIIVRERIIIGDSNSQIFNYLTSKYGDFILLKPPFNITTILLWLSPILLIIFALWCVFIFYYKTNHNPPNKQSTSNTKPLNTTQSKKKSMEHHIIKILWAVLPIVMLAVYQVIGIPTMADFPLSSRSVELSQSRQINQQQTAILAMINKLENRLKTQTPNNIGDWQKLAKSYGVLAMTNKQIDAFKGWAKADKTNTLPLLYQARSLRLLTNNISTPVTFDLMEQVLIIDKNNIEALYLSALFLQQNTNYLHSGQPISMRIKKLLKRLNKNPQEYQKLRIKIQQVFNK